MKRITGLTSKEEKIIDERIEYYYDNEDYTDDINELLSFVIEGGEIDGKKYELIKKYITKNQFVRLTERDLTRLVKRTITELDRSTYYNAADVAGERGYNKLSNKFREHGKEFGLNQERDNVTMVVKDRGGEKILNVRIIGVEGNRNYSYSKDFVLKTENLDNGSSIIFNINKLPGKMEFYLDWDYSSLPKTRKDAKKVLEAFDDIGIGVDDIDLRSITYDDSGF